MKKCSKINLRGQICRFKLLTRQLNKPDRAEDLGIIIADDLPWKTRAKTAQKSQQSVILIEKELGVVKGVLVY